MRLRLFLSFFLVLLVSIGSVVLIARRGAASEVRTFMFRGGMAGGDVLVDQLEDYYRLNRSWVGVEAQLEASMGGRGWGRGNSTMPQHMGAMMGQRIRLADSQGNLLLDTAPTTPAASLDPSELQSAIPLQVDGETVGYLLMQGGMAFTAADETRLVTRLNNAALTAGLIAAGISLILALILAYSLERPMRELTQAARRMASGDLSPRVPVSGHDELAVLASSFNHLAGSLQEAEASRRAMTADIAHELRTPLAVQRANLEALQDGVYPLTSTNLQPVLDQNRMLTRLVDDLGTLALADAGQLDLQRAPTHLPTLVANLVERFEPQAIARQVNLRYNPPEQPAHSAWTLSVDPTRLEQIIGNLLSNAIRYTPEGGQVELTLERLPASVQLSVRDSGPGIPPEALPRLFERFYRADRSRSRAEGGSGLGLAIARQLAQAHGGSLSAANHPQGGALFTLSLPISLPPPHEAQ
ncbi:MAG: ATP-binding protein [Anaerolineales bacterium]|nr:ATP-binding protein [Anaerolineales bacterium]